MLAAGLHCWRRHTCTDHRSRWPSVSCTRRPARPATCHPSTWRPAESTRLPPTSMCVPDRTHRPYAEPGYGYRQPSYGVGSRLPRTGSGLWRVRTGLRRAAGLCRPRARLSRAYYARAYYARERYYAQEYDYEYAPRPPLPVPYRRARGHDATTAMAGGPTAIEVGSACCVWMGGAQRYPSLGAAIDVARRSTIVAFAEMMGSLYPSYRRKLRLGSEQMTPASAGHRLRRGRADDGDHGASFCGADVWRWRKSTSAARGGWLGAGK